MNGGVNKGFKPFELPFIEQSLSFEVNESLVIYDDFGLLPINVRVPSFAKKKIASRL